MKLFLSFSGSFEVISINYNNLTNIFFKWEGGFYFIFISGNKVIEALIIISLTKEAYF